VVQFYWLGPQGGKSSARDVYSLMNGCVLLTISPLLSLGSDQEEKLKLKASQALGAVCPIHVDEFRSIPEQKKLVGQIKTLSDRWSHYCILICIPSGYCEERGMVRFAGFSNRPWTSVNGLCRRTPFVRPLWDDIPEGIPTIGQELVCETMSWK
jgi:hypothetical protein